MTTIPPLQVLSSHEIDTLHQKTLLHLEKHGIQVQHPEGLQRLLEAGAAVDHTTRIAKFSPELVESCLSSVGRKFVMAGRDPDRDLLITPDKKLMSRNGGGPGHVLDHQNQQVRPATLQDTRDYARLVDALPEMDIAAPVYPQDIPAGWRDLQALEALFASTTKPINMRLLNPASLPYVLRMAEAVAGDSKMLRERPPLTMLESPITPLKIPHVLVETLWACGEAGIPVEICSMPINGATGPVTLAGSLLMSNIEMVAAIVVSQVANPGAPLIFTPRIMVMDMASGHAMTGSMENALLASAGAQLALQAYQIPVNMHGPYTDSPISDTQAGMENTYFTLLPALAGANILTGAGHLEGGLVVSFTQLLLDNTLMGLVRRAIQGINVDEDSMAASAIARSIESGNLLTDDHTLQFLRSEPRYRSPLLNRQTRQSWLDSGGHDMARNAVDKAAALLKTHQPEPLAAEMERELKDILGHASRELA